ncbi:MAG: ABC transporter permease subunit [Sedimentisphaerales bacterium]|nr:ABC transporter permease subunit [Sedimentisphaerales bacterium]
MTIELTNSFLDVFNPARWFGPIFDKELRVSSRRRRNYVLRCAYIAVLCVFILSSWYSILGARSLKSSVYQVSRFSQIGQTVIASIVWFQFVAAQLIAIVMLSASISDEIRTGTLAVLMTTPIRSVQIVAGKLLSKLIQLILLLAISFPLLAIVRVFGGVTWTYVLSSVCVTLTAVVLAGALSLLLSMSYRQAHIVILVTVTAFMVVFGVLSGLCNLLAVNDIFFFSQNTTQSILVLINPFWAFFAINAKYLFHSSAPASFSWPLHCLLMLALTTIVLGLSVRRVRKAILGNAFGQESRLKFGRGSKRKIRTYSDRVRYAPMSPVTGSPIIWKEMHKGLIGRRQGEIVLFVLLIGAFLLLAFSILFAGRRNISFMVLPSFLLSALYLIVMIRLAVFSAGSFTMEKEARTWPILLTTPLADSEIVRGKAIGAFRRNMLLILMYFGLLCLSYFFFRKAYRDDWLIHALSSFVVSACSLTGSVLFVIGSGLYLGVCLKTTTTAVAATVGLYLGVTYLLGGLFSPVRLLFFRSISRQDLPWVVYAMPIALAIVKAGIGGIFARRAVRQLRRHIF